MNIASHGQDTSLDMFGMFMEYINCLNKGSCLNNMLSNIGNLLPEQ